MLLEVKGNDPLNILKSTLSVLENAKSVKLLDGKIHSISLAIKHQLKKGLDAPEVGFGTSGNFTDDVQLIFLEDSVNFCFWAELDKPKWSIEWPKGNIVTGGWYSLKSCFERALAHKMPILNARYLSTITIKDCKNLFKGVGGVEIPLLKERQVVLNETGKILLNKFDGKAINLVDHAQNDAIKLIKLIYDNFPSFKDTASFSGKKVYFLKRAQIVANDISYLTSEKLTRLDRLTAFADYKIPQMLRAFGVLKYSKDLEEKIDNYILIPKGSREELEIRSAAIWGIELIRQLIPENTASEIDNALWLISQDLSKQVKPYHRTYTIFY